MSSDASPPSTKQVAHLAATDSTGLLWFSCALALSASGTFLALRPEWWFWLAGELLLASAFVQWFVLLHECGHRMLFRRAPLNTLAGHIAGFFSIIPFEAWKRVHGRHHKWTGWQDLDPTTAALTPRPLSLFERVLINICWRCWIPLFATLYRLTNFWNPLRLWKMFPAPAVRRSLFLNLAILVLVYAGLSWAISPSLLLRVAGLALLLAFMIEEILLLSQHTHVPMGLSHGEPVTAHPPLEQQPFTRSLRLPPWISRLLLHFDAHELHHMYPFVPGYRLLEIPHTPGNEVPWWRWIPAARAVPGEVFFFQNRDHSGFDV